MRTRWCCPAVALLFLSLVAAPASSQAVAPSTLSTPAVRPESARTPLTYRVLRVVDGDTVILKMGGKTVKARLIGVDTPETVHPTKPVERFGREASAFLKGLVEGKDVAVEYESGPSALDKYGRLLVFLYLEPGHRSINREIIARGYGHAYTSYPFRYMDDYRAAERAAREGQFGLWAPETEQKPEVAVAVPTPVNPPRPKARTTPRTVLRPRPAGASTRDDQVTTTVYVTRTGAKYHAEGCRHLARSSIPTSLASAAARFSPCSVCDPPTASRSTVGAASAALAGPTNFQSRRSSSAGGGSSSGLCGAPTKKSGACRRPVRGGGYCYQHR